MAKNNYHHDNLKTELIKKGIKILGKEGYTGLSLRKVAKACNVSHAAPYRHFKNKDELIHAIALEAMGKFNQALQEAVDKYPEEPEKQLREMGCSYVQFFAENPEYFKLIFFSDLNEGILQWPLDQNKPLSKDHVSNGHPFQTLYRTVERYMVENQNETALTMDQNTLILYCWGLVHGISTLISKQEFLCEGDYLELTRKIMWGETFLKQ